MEGNNYMRNIHKHVLKHIHEEKSNNFDRSVQFVKVLFVFEEIQDGYKNAMLKLW